VFLLSRTSWFDKGGHTTSLAATPVVAS